MKKQTIQRFSLLGLVLIAVSAVTAAVLPSKVKTEASNFAAGSVTNSSSFSIKETCAPTVDGATDRACLVTSATRTTGHPLGNSNTVGNTTCTDC